MERRCAVQRTRCGADGSTRCGRQSPGGPYMRHASKVVERRADSGRQFACGRAVTPALRTPPRRTPARPFSCRPFENPRPAAAKWRQPHSGPPDSGRALSPSHRRPPGRSPAERSAVLRTESVEPQSRRPQRTVFAGKRLSPDSNPRPSSLQTLSLDHSDTAELPSLSLRSLPLAARCGRPHGGVRPGALTPLPLARLAEQSALWCLPRAACRALGRLRAARRTRAFGGAFFAAVRSFGST